MNTYTCPMHPEIEQTTPGSCPKCGMKLILKSELTNKHPDNLEKITFKSYLPLFTIVGLILLTSAVISLKMSHLLSILHILNNFMVGFFLVFSGFKLMDLKGFAQGYYTYDLLAKHIYNYGYIYPFIELFFGLSMILNVFPKEILILEIIVMGFSGIGVASKLYKGEKFQCACLGTFLKVPLTKITLIEDFGMVAGAIILLINS